MVKTLAEQHGLRATFMPKPFMNLTGSGCHTHVSLWDAAGQNNLFLDEKGELGLSRLAYQFLGGVLHHGEALTALFTPTVNSFKRINAAPTLSGATWSPNTISYGGNNRTHMLRIPMGGGRVESRAVDTAANPYLAAAMLLGAGLEGIEQELDPGDPIRLNMYEQSDEQLAELGVNVLPRTLLEAVEAFDADPLGEQVFGRELKDSYVRLKSQEWWEYHNTVSEWEYDRYLEFF
jgi:glutamine synthetase